MIDEMIKWANKTKFNSHDDFETSPCAEIKCPICNNGLNIKMKDLNKHQDSHISNLKKEDDDFLTRIIVDSAPTFTNSSLDYYCPNCKSATRILYDFWAGGRHGEYGFDLKYIANIK
jgi:Zn finger protein HypA/HybF involved in hydrogenase expression